GAAVTEALRVDLGQSDAVRLLDGRQVAAALRRMGARADTTLGEALARELALREGAKAVVAGEIARLGSGYVLSARLVTADSGSVLAPVRVTADGDGQLIGAVNRLSSRLRERIGESLRRIRGGEPLDQVTTASLPALRLYTEGTRAFNAGDFVRARRLLEQAVRIDTAFAMAWRRLAALYFNMRADTRSRFEASRRALAHRDRLPPLERYLTEGDYYTLTDRTDPERGIAAYRAALELDPENTTALNNLGLALQRTGPLAEAEEVLWRGIRLRGPLSLHINQVTVLAAQRKWASLDSLFAHAERVAPRGSIGPVVVRLAAAVAQRDYARVESLVAAHEGRRAGSDWIHPIRVARLELEVRRGRLRRAERLAAELADSLRADGDRQQAAEIALLAVFHELRRGTPEAARAALARVLAGPAFRGLPEPDWPHLTLAKAHAELGDPAATRRVRRVFEAVEPPETRGRFEPDLWDGLEAEAERRWRDAAAAFSRSTRMRQCSPCGAHFAGEMWDRAGVPDSALVYYHLAIDRAPWPVMGWEDQLYYSLSLRRLGELHDLRGERDAALEWYGRFLELWHAADPELQPTVRAIRERVAALVGED
ncbi:MAG TPA: tetratricopeptide repeat protein, partial [Gemmatimonadales bacterium]|nr:tetratricopeptide repeat protein [Gemmatimonadales bacterium]